MHADPRIGGFYDHVHSALFRRVYPKPPFFQKKTIHSPPLPSLVFLLFWLMLPGGGMASRNTPPLWVCPLALPPLRPPQPIGVFLCVWGLVGGWQSDRGANRMRFNRVRGWRGGVRFTRLACSKTIYLSIQALAGIAVGMLAARLAARSQNDKNIFFV